MLARCEITNPLAGPDRKLANKAVLLAIVTGYYETSGVEGDT